MTDTDMNAMTWEMHNAMADEQWLQPLLKFKTLFANLNETSICLLAHQHLAYFV